MIKWVSEGKAGKGMGYPAKGFKWVMAVKPTAEERKRLSKDFKVPERILDRFTTESIPRIYSRKPFTFTIVDYHVEGKVERDSILFVVTQDHVLTVLSGPLKVYDSVFKSVQDGKIPLDAMELLFEILDADADDNYKVLEFIEDKITLLEENITTRKNITKDLKEVVLLKRQLVDISKVFWQTLRVIFTLKHGSSNIVQTPVQERILDEVYSIYSHQIDIASTQREMLSDAITVAQTTISNKLAEISNKINISIKRLTFITLLLTGIATVISVPNTAATILGIPYFNIDPAAAWQLVLIALLLTTAVPVIWFYRYWRNKVMQSFMNEGEQ